MCCSFFWPTNRSDDNVSNFKAKKLILTRSVNVAERSLTFDAFSRVNFFRIIIASIWKLYSPWNLHLRLRNKTKWTLHYAKFHIFGYLINSCSASGTLSFFEYFYVECTSYPYLPRKSSIIDDGGFNRNLILSANRKCKQEFRSKEIPMRFHGLR